MSDTQSPITLLELNRLIAGLVSVPQTTGLWVTAELSDVSVRGGHCYFELLQKDDRGMPVARTRATIWAGNYHRIVPKFERATSQRFASGIKVMLQVTVGMHPVYGLSVNVSDIDPSFTLGDLELRRREILARLQAEGVLENNRTLPWPDIPTRIAIISAPKAAGYGDFVNQLFSNPSHIKFEARLFPAIMQGDKAPASIISALDAIASQVDRWDCVVIIRGGGATSDLQAFEDYDLAANVANFPIPIVIGIGHERDRSVLDWVANMRVKTPTAAAEWLINRAESLLTALRNISSRILQTVSDRLSGAREQLSHSAGMLPILPRGCVDRARARLNTCAGGLATMRERHILPRMERIDIYRQTLLASVPMAVNRQNQRFDTMATLLDALSPMAVLRRGYSITRLPDGTICQSADNIPAGTTITTTLASGTLTSTTCQPSTD